VTTEDIGARPVAPLIISPYLCCDSRMVQGREPCAGDADAGDVEEAGSAGKANKASLSAGMQDNMKEREKDRCMSDRIPWAQSRI
jgi:hypothetical protein